MTGDGISSSINKDGVATITIDRQKTLNAFDRGQVLAFNTALDRLDVEQGLRALVIKGAGKIFCAGADVRYLRDFGAGSWSDNLADARDYAGMSKKMRSLPVPVISCVQGGAYGGGIGVVAASDIVIAEDSATFAVTEGRYGFTASIMMPYLLPRIGIRQARRWCLTSELMSAKEALRIGLIDETVAVGGLDNALDAALDDILLNGPSGVQETKLAMNRLSSPPFDDNTIGRSVDAFAKGRACDSAKEGAASFLEKRKPIFKGQ